MKLDSLFTVWANLMGEFKLNFIEAGKCDIGGMYLMKAPCHRNGERLYLSIHFTQEEIELITLAR